MKKTFISSKKFSVITFHILIVSTTLAYWKLAPTGADITNGRIIEIFNIAGWFTGILIAIISAIILTILTAIGRLLDLCRFKLVHAFGVIASLLPWLIMSWQITAEPRYTNIGIAIIDFIARPMLWGSLSALIFTVIITLLSLISLKKK